MTLNRITPVVILALICCVVLVLAPLSVAAQEGVIKKGAEGVKKGVETGAEKTKEGAEAVGKGVKDVFTEDDKNTTTQQEQKTTTEPTTTRSKPETTTPGTTTTTESTTEKKDLPATAGELPLLALIGALALAGAGTTRVLRRVR